MNLIAVCGLGGLLTFILKEVLLRLVYLVCSGGRVGRNSTLRYCVLTTIMHFEQRDAENFDNFGPDAAVSRSDPLFDERVKRTYGSGVSASCS